MTRIYLVGRLYLGIYLAYPRDCVYKNMGIVRRYANLIVVYMDLKPMRNVCTQVYAAKKKKTNKQTNKPYTLS